MDSPSVLIWIIVIAGLGLVLVLLNRTMWSGRDRSRFGRQQGDRRRTSRSANGGNTPPPPPPPPDQTGHTRNPQQSSADEVIPPQLENVSYHAGDEVVCSAYAPSSMPVGGDYMVQAWLHLPEQQTEVDSSARMQDDTASQRAKTFLSAKLETGDNVQVILRCADVEIDEPEQFAVWNGRPENISFFVNVPASLAKSALFFAVELFHNAIPVGKLKFRVSTTPDLAVTPSPAGIEADQYEHAFISYASDDRDAVLARVQGMKAAGKYRIFQDVMVLEQGDQWEPRLAEEIAKCDVFFLFWSQNAKASDWVKKEFVMAVDRKHGDDNAAPRIHPIPIEHPIVRPWEDLRTELGKYHLNDQTLYFMSSRG